jgi:hypothetical protein
MILQLNATAVNVTAVRAPKPETKKLTRRNANREIGKVFDDHAHDVVGTFGVMSEAVAAGDAYARAWLKKARCACKKIGHAR